MDEELTGLRNPYVLSPDTSRILRENTELRREIEAMKRALDVRRHPPEAEATLNEVRDSQFDGEGESLKEKYDEARRLNDFFKDQVDFLTQQLNIIVTVAPPDGEESGRWTDEEGKILTIVRSNMNIPEQQESLAKLDRTVQKLKDQMGRAKKKMAVMARGLEERDEEIDCLKHVVEELTKANHNLKNESASLKKKRNKENNELQRLELELDNLKELTAGNEKDLVKKESTIQELQEKITSLKKEIEEWKRRNGKIANELKGLKTKRSAIPAMKPEELKLKDKHIEELEKQNKQLKKDVKNEKAAKAKEEMKSASNIERLMEEVATLRDVITSMRQGKLSSSAVELHALEAANKQLQLKLAKKQELYAALKHASKEQVKTLEEQQSLHAQETKHNKDLQKMLRSAQKKIADLEKEVEKESHQLEEMTTRESEVVTEFESILNLAEEKQQLIDRLNFDREKASKFIQFLEGEVERLKQNKADNVSSNVAELQRKNASLRKDLSKMKKNYQDEINELKAFRKPQPSVSVPRENPDSEQLKEVLEQNKASERIIKRLEKERIGLNEKFQNLHKQLKEQRERYEKVAESMKDELALNPSRRKLKERTNHTNELTGVSSESVRGLPTPPEIVTMEETNSLHKKPSASVSKENPDSEQLKEALAQNKVLKRINKRLEKERNGLSEELQNLHKQFKEQQERYETDMELLKDELTFDTNRLEKERNGLNEKLQNLHKQLKEQRERYNKEVESIKGELAFNTNRLEKKRNGLNEKLQNLHKLLKEQREKYEKDAESLKHKLALNTNREFKDRSNNTNELTGAPHEPVRELPTPSKIVIVEETNSSHRKPSDSFSKENPDSEQLKHALEQNKTSERFIKRLEKERDGLNEKLRNLHQRLKLQRERYEKDVKSLKDEFSLNTKSSRKLDSDHFRADYKDGTPAGEVKGSRGNEEENQTIEERIRALEKFHKDDIDNLKQKKTQLKDKLRNLENENQSLRESNAKLMIELDDCRNKCAKEEAEKMKLQNEIQQLQERHEVINKDQVPRDVLKKRIRELEDELEVTRMKLDTSLGNVETLKNLRDVAMKNKEKKLLEARKKLADCERSLSQLQASKNRHEYAQIDDENKGLKETIEQQQETIKNLEELAADLTRNILPVDTKTYFLCRTSNVSLSYENLKLKHEINVLKKKFFLSGKEADASLKDCPFCDQFRRQLSGMDSEVDRLRAELTHFDGYFFNEVDDLRHNYAEAVKLNVFYEQQLKEISARHGVSVNIRMDVVDSTGEGGVGKDGSKTDGKEESKPSDSQSNE